MMGMHNQFYWRRVMLEDFDHCTQPVERALAPLRSFIYRMVLKRGDNFVVEYGLAATGGLDQFRVS